MAEHPLSIPAPSAWEPHRSALARTLLHARTDAGCSTRELARRARISQAYVVALEGGQRTPTIDVLARLAEALGLEPTELLERSLRRRAEHLLLVVDDDLTPVVAAARRATRRKAEHWVWASSSGDTPVGARHHIDLRRNDRHASSRTYRPLDISRSLVDELDGISAHFDDGPLGLIFADTSSVMCALPDPGVVIDFEHGWADAVDNAAVATGANAVANVCVYRIDDLRSLPNPTSATLDLIRSHDAVWSARGQRVVGGEAAVRRVLNLIGAAA